MYSNNLEVSTLILLQKHRDTNGRRVVIQIGGVYTTFCQEEGILLQKYHDRNGMCIAMLFKSIAARGRLDSPDGVNECLIRIASIRNYYFNSQGFCPLNFVNKFQGDANHEVHSVN